MGAGHERASRELARRLEERGHRAVVVDFLDAFPLFLSRLWRGFYLLQLRRFPESYESSYQLFYAHPGLWAPFVRFERLLAGRRVMRWVSQYRPDAIVSTYSFATLVVGRLREEGAITVPTVNFLTDFGVHPRTVHPAIDLNLAVHPIAAEQARRYVEAPVIATGPAVSPAFGVDAPARAVARKELGLADDDRMVLVASGSWGIGHDLESTVAALVGRPGLTVVTVCGSDEGLQRRLVERRLGIALGWTDRMPSLMAAADVVVENAGGLTSLEAFASGVPIITYRPIPGHGRDNTKAMVAAGVTTNASTEDELVAAVERLAWPGPDRQRQLDAAKAMFVEDPADRILELLGTVSVGG